jgi:transcriptional regulator GlxA family with amidase domain
MEWVRRLRLERYAALRDSGIDVAQAARRVGYASPSALAAARRRARARD